MEWARERSRSKLWEADERKVTSRHWNLDALSRPSEAGISSESESDAETSASGWRLAGGWRLTSGVVVHRRTRRREGDPASVRRDAWSQTRSRVRERGEREESIAANLRALRGWNSIQSTIIAA